MENNQQKAAAVIVAAGESRRMEGIDKVLALLGGKPILARVINTFQKHNTLHPWVHAHAISPTLTRTSNTG